MKSLYSAGAEARYLSSGENSDVDILVKTLLPSIHKSSRDTGSLLLPILLRNGDEHRSVGVVSFCVNLSLAESYRKEG